MALRRTGRAPSRGREALPPALRRGNPPADGSGLDTRVTIRAHIGRASHRNRSKAAGIVLGSRRRSPLRTPTIAAEVDSRRRLRLVTRHRRDPGRQGQGTPLRRHPDTTLPVTTRRTTTNPAIARHRALHVAETANRGVDTVNRGVAAGAGHMEEADTLPAATAGNPDDFPSAAPVSFDEPERHFFRENDSCAGTATPFRRDITARPSTPA